MSSLLRTPGMLRLRSVVLPRPRSWRAYQTDRYSRPGPIPLGDRAKQREFEALVRQQTIEDQRQAEEELAKEEAGNAEETKSEDSLIDENGVNRLTGEVNGPRGAEPTRYGDWEYKGRVYDF
jgi:hypothetical protein